MDFTLCFILFSLALSFSQAIKVPMPDRSTKKYLGVNSFCSGKKVYCREGSRGPCGENQVLAVEVDSSRTPDTFHSSEILDNADCTTQLDADATYSDARGVCVWSQVDHPCYGFPASYRLYPEDGECYSAVDDSFQCKDFQTFYAVNETVGTCDCEVSEDKSTPYLYWPETDGWYKRNSQGPCSTGEWLTLDSSGNPRCEITSCPANGSYVYYSNGEQEPACYELYTDGPCPGGLELHRVQIFPEKYECGRITVVPVAVVTAKLRTLNCKAGSKVWVNGKCRKVYS